MTKWIISIGSVLAAIATALTFFGSYGWVTRTAYAQDHGDQPITVQMQQIQQSLDTILTAQTSLRSEWKCTEIANELPELELEKLTPDNDMDRIRMQQRIDNLKELWRDLECSRFTE